MGKKHQGSRKPSNIRGKNDEIIAKIHSVQRDALKKFVNDATTSVVSHHDNCTGNSNDERYDSVGKSINKVNRHSIISNTIVGERAGSTSPSYGSISEDNSAFTHSKLQSTWMDSRGCSPPPYESLNRMSTESIPRFMPPILPTEDTRKLLSGKSGKFFSIKRQDEAKLYKRSAPSSLVKSSSYVTRNSSIDQDESNNIQSKSINEPVPSPSRPDRTVEIRAISLNVNGYGKGQVHDTITSSSRNGELKQAENDVKAVIDIMKYSIEKVIERDEKLSELDRRADVLESKASQFEKHSKKLKSEKWWKVKKIQLCLLSIFVLCILALTATIIYEIFVLRSRRTTTTDHDVASKKDSNILSNLEEKFFKRG